MGKIYDSARDYRCGAGLPGKTIEDLFLRFARNIEEEISETKGGNQKVLKLILVALKRGDFDIALHITKNAIMTEE